MAATHRIETVEALGGADLVDLDRPASGDRGGAALMVAGSTEDPRIVAIEAARGRVLGELPITDGAFSGAVDLTGLDTNLRVRLQARMRNGNQRPLARVSIGRAAAPDDPGGSQPLAVTSMGRSGSTYLMHLLLGHPEIGGHAEYPYEGRWIAYSLALRRLAIEAPSALRKHHPARTPWAPGSPIEPGIPASEAAEGREQAADQMARIAIRAAVDPAIRFIAEKGAPIAELRELFAAPEEILLVRDPRDVFASVLAFNRKRGFDDFGRQSVDSDEAFVEPFAERAQRFAALVNARRDQAVVVRYEDLATDPAAVWDTLTTSLGLDAAARVDGSSEALEAHRTSPDAAASVGKWRSELPADLAGKLGDALAPVLDGLGYE